MIYKKQIDFLKKSFCDDKLNIVWFLTKEKHGVDQKRIFETINYVSKNNEFRIFLKPHTRGQTDHINYLLKNKNLIMCESYSSFSLQKFCDATIFSATSVIIDSLFDKKPTFYLRKTVFNSLIYDTFFKDWYVDSKSDLLNELSRLKKSDVEKKITLNELESFKSKLIFPINEKVLDIYENYFIKSVLKK